MKIETQTTEPTITLVTPSDQEMVTTHFCDTVYRYWSVSMTKQELIDCEFDVSMFASDNPDRIDINGESCEDVDETDQEGPFSEWRDEWEDADDEEQE
jgi:pyridoxine 5'-phosphate synthase PdxJ